VSVKSVRVQLCRRHRRALTWSAGQHQELIVLSSSHVAPTYRTASVLYHTTSIHPQRVGSGGESKVTCPWPPPLPPDCACRRRSRLCQRTHCPCSRVPPRRPCPPPALLPTLPPALLSSVCRHPHPSPASATAARAPLLRPPPAPAACIRHACHRLCLSPAPAACTHGPHLPPALACCTPAGGCNAKPTCPTRQRTRALAWPRSRCALRT
jgi:hypothetical protein